MRHPLVYEINTRCWLLELSARHHHQITLGTVPEEEFARWRSLGFTHLWLMGVWPTGPRSRAVSLASPELRRAMSKILPDWKEAEFVGSPFAPADYIIAEVLGGEAGLRQFRRQLHAYGLKLLLDFVPNHLGLDHPWVQERPELFVQAEGKTRDCFPAETNAGIRWLAHGKDPNFPAWIDTVQLDYRRPETHAAMIEVLQQVAERCDGVRCDMAMLLLKQVFATTWQLLPCPSPPADREFWADAIEFVKRSHPDFRFLGEVYWDLEERLQSLGFDYTYDKRLYDALVYHNPPEVQRRLVAVTPEFLARSAHFIENHDEPRIASILSLQEHRAAALLTLGLPGLRLLHEGQLAGWRIRTPVQLARRPIEEVQPDIESLYRDLLRELKRTAVGGGESKLLTPRPAGADSSTCQNVVAVRWQSKSDSFDLVAVNLAAQRSQCLIPLADSANHTWRMKDLLGNEDEQRWVEDSSLHLDLPPHGARLYHFASVS